MTENKDEDFQACIDDVDHFIERFKRLSEGPAGETFKKQLDRLFLMRERLEKMRLIANSGGLRQSVEGVTKRGFKQLEEEFGKLGESLNDRIDIVMSSLTKVVQRQDKLAGQVGDGSPKVEGVASVSVDNSKLEAKLDRVAANLAELRNEGDNERVGALAHQIRDLESLLRNLLRELERGGKSFNQPGVLPGGLHKGPPSKRRRPSANPLKDVPGRS